MVKRTALKVINAVEQAEGAGARVRRSIGVMNNRKFNPFLMLDHFKITPQAGFPNHGHRGQETITLVLKGAVAHEDFTGSKGILYPGDLQFMTAGKGVVHLEMPVDLDGSQQVVEGMQLWVDLPEALRDCQPRYRDLRAYEIPEVRADDGKVVVKVILGLLYGVDSVTDLAYTPVQYYYATIKPTGVYRQRVPAGYNFFAYFLKGESALVGETKVEQFQSVFFNQEGDEVEIVNTGSDDIELVLVGGEVLDQTTVQYGPFVASSDASIRKAFADYQYARNGFENLRTWQSLISNGVTRDMIPELDANKQEREQAYRDRTIATNDEL